MNKAIINFFGTSWDEETFKYQIVLWGISLLVWLFLVKKLLIGMKKLPRAKNLVTYFIRLLSASIVALGLALASLYFVNAPFGLAKNFLGMSNEAALGVSFAVWSMLILYISHRLSQIRKKR